MRYIKYIGLAHIRQITARDWRSVGVTGDTVVWSAQNGFAVPLDALTEDQIVKGIENDPEFVITGADEDFTPEPQATDMTPSQLVQTTQNPVDVVAWANGDDDFIRDILRCLGLPRGGAGFSRLVRRRRPALRQAKRSTNARSSLPTPQVRGVGHALRGRGGHRGDVPRPRLVREVEVDTVANYTSWHKQLEEAAV